MAFNVPKLPHIKYRYCNHAQTVRVCATTFAFKTLFTSPTLTDIEGGGAESVPRHGWLGKNDRVNMKKLYFSNRY